MFHWHQCLTIISISLEAYIDCLATLLIGSTRIQPHALVIFLFDALNLIRWSFVLLTILPLTNLVKVPRHFIVLFVLCRGFDFSIVLGLSCLRPCRFAGLCQLRLRLDFWQIIPLHQAQLHAFFHKFQFEVGLLHKRNYSLLFLDLLNLKVLLFLNCFFAKVHFFLECEGIKLVLSAHDHVENGDEDCHPTHAHTD